MAVVERFHSTINEIYRLAKYEKCDSDAASVMTYAIMAYNNSIHSATNFTPFEIVFGNTDANNVFDFERERNLMQKLLQDHRKRLKVLYEYVADKLKEDKVKVRDKRGGEEPPEIKEGDEIFMKNTRTRKAKDLPRFEKAKVIGKPDRNIIPVELKKRKTRVAIKNIKRPPQVKPSTSGTNQLEQQPGPSKSGEKSGNSTDETWDGSDED